MGLPGPLYEQPPSLRAQADGLEPGLGSWHCCFSMTGGQCLDPGLV